MSTNEIKSVKQKLKIENIQNLNKTDSNIRKRGVDMNKKKRTTIKNIRAENFKENIWGNKGGKWNLEKKEKSGTG